MELRKKVEVAVMTATGMAATLFVGAVLCAVIGSGKVIILAVAVGIVALIFWWFLQEEATTND